MHVDSLKKYHHTKPVLAVTKLQSIAQRLSTEWLVNHCASFFFLPRAGRYPLACDILHRFGGSEILRLVSIESARFFLKII